MVKQNCLGIHLRKRVVKISESVSEMHREINVLSTVGGAAELVSDLLDLAEAREWLRILVLDLVLNSSILETVADGLFVNEGARMNQNVLHSATAPC